MAELTHFETNGQIFNLKTPIVLTISKEDDGIYAENTECDILGYGESEEEAIEDAREELGQRYEWRFEDILPIPDDIPEWIGKINSLME